MHAGTFEASSDGDLAAGFHDTRGCTKTSGMEEVISHSVSVALDVGGTFSGCVTCWCLDLEAADECIEVSAVEFFASFCGPLVAEVAWGAEDRFGDFVEMLFDMEAIDNLDGVGEELVSGVPDEGSAVCDDCLAFGVVEASSSCLAHDALGKGRQFGAGIG